MRSRAWFAALGRISRTGAGSAQRRGRRRVTSGRHAGASCVRAEGLDPGCPSGRADRPVPRRPGPASQDPGSRAGRALELARRTVRSRFSSLQRTSAILGSADDDGCRHSSTGGPHDGVGGRAAAAADGGGRDTGRSRRVVGSAARLGGHPFREARLARPAGRVHRPRPGAPRMGCRPVVGSVRSSAGRLSAGTATAQRTPAAAPRR